VCDPLPDDRVLATWPIQSICSPGGGPAQPERTTLKTLADGTMIIESLGRCFRARYRRCMTKCLPPDARIATPSGEVPISELRVGMSVWTQDVAGMKVAGRVELISTPRVVGVHHVARVVLSDGRSLVASPEHPMVNRQRVEDLRVGDLYDGAAITEVEVVVYTGDRTYDILPSLGTGVYWVNGIPAATTITRIE
jgi:hypothetical protein